MSRCKKINISWSVVLSKVYFNNSLFLKYDICSTVLQSYSILCGLKNEPVEVGYICRPKPSYNFWMPQFMTVLGTRHCGLSLSKNGFLWNMWVFGVQFHFTSHLVPICAWQRWWSRSADRWHGAHHCCLRWPPALYWVSTDKTRWFLGVVDGVGGWHPLLFTKDSYWEFITELCGYLQLFWIYF